MVDYNYKMPNGCFMKVYYGGFISRAVLHVISEAVWENIQVFTENNDVLKYNIDFWVKNPETGQNFNFYAHMPSNVLSIGSNNLRLAFQALYTVLDEKTIPNRLALSWDLLKPDGVTPILSGFFRQKLSN